MKKLKTIILAVLVLISFIGVNASLEGITSYYPFDNDTTTGTTSIDIVGNYNGTIVNLDTGQNGKINESYYYGPDQDSVNLVGFVPHYDAFTFTSWVKIDDDNKHMQVFSHAHSANAGSVGVSIFEKIPRLTIADTEGGAMGCVFNSTINAGEWYFIAGTWNKSGVGRIYVNDQYIQCDNNNYSDGRVTPNLDAKFGILKIEREYRGFIDEGGIWTKNLSTQDLAIIYNNGDGLQYPFSLKNIFFDQIKANNVTFINNSFFNVSDINFTVKINVTATNNNTNISYNLNEKRDILKDSLGNNVSVDFYKQFATNSLEGNINATISNNYENFTYSGNEVRINISGTLYNVLYNQENARRFCYENTNRSFYVHYNGTQEFTPALRATWNGTNWTTTLDRKLINDIECLLPLVKNTITFFAYNNETNTTTEKFYFGSDTKPPNLVVNSFSTTNSYITNFSQLINVSDDFDFSCSVTTDENRTFSCFNQSYSWLTNGNHSFNVTANDSAGNRNNSYNNIVFVNPEQYFFFFDNTNGSFVENYTFGNYSSNGTRITIPLYDLGLGNHSLLFDKLGYVKQFFNFSFNLTSKLNLTYNLTQSTVTIFFFDKANNSLIKENVSMNLIGAVGFADSTTTGNITIGKLLLQAGEYKIVGTSQNYSTEIYYFSFDNQEQIQINIYMLRLDDPNKGTIKIIVLNDAGEEQNLALVKLLEWKPAQSAFVDVSQTKTNLNGEAFFNIEIGTKSYIFQAIKDNLSAKSSEDGEVIFNDNEARTLILTLLPQITNPVLDGIQYNITENTTQRNFNKSQIFFSWNDPRNTVTKACLEYYKENYASKIFLVENCVEASTGQMFPVFNINKSFNTVVEAKLYVGGDNPYKLQTFYYKSSENFESVFANYGFLSWILLFIAIAVLVFGLNIGNLYVSAIGFTVFSWVAVLFVPSFMTGKVATFITIVCILICTGGFKRE